MNTKGPKQDIQNLGKVTYVGGRRKYLHNWVRSHMSEAEESYIKTHHVYVSFTKLQVFISKATKVVIRNHKSKDRHCNGQPN